MLYAFKVRFIRVSGKQVGLLCSYYTSRRGIEEIPYCSNIFVDTDIVCPSRGRYRQNYILNY